MMIVKETPPGRCGIELFWEPGKLPPPVPTRSERVAGSAGIPHATDPPAGADQRTHAAIGESSRRTRVQRACPLSRRSKLRSLRFRLTAKTAYRCVAPPLRTANASLVCTSAGKRRRERHGSPCGICTDLVQNSIRDRHRYVAADPRNDAALRL